MHKSGLIFAKAMKLLYLHSVFVTDRSGWVTDVKRFEDKFNHRHWLIEGCC
jgi:hypothetical protein